MKNGREKKKREGIEEKGRREMENDHVHTSQLMGGRRKLLDAKFEASL